MEQAEQTADVAQRKSKRFLGALAGVRILPSAHGSFHVVARSSEQLAVGPQDLQAALARSRVVASVEG